MNCTRPGGWFAISDQIGNKCIDSGVQTITMEVGSAAARRGLSPESPAATERWTMPRGRPNRQPSARNLELYHELVCEGRSRREVAARFRLSRPRVTQPRAQVAEWVAAMLPPGRQGDAGGRARAIGLLSVHILHNAGRSSWIATDYNERT